MKDILRQERGVSLISLAAVIIVIGIITTILLYSIRDTEDVSKLTNLYTDIDNLEDRISNYYTTYGAIPAFPVEKLGGVNNVMSNIENAPVGANDTGDFLVIDLSALENLTLNYGKDYENFKNLTENGNSIGDSRDLYVINENSHNIFYLKGIQTTEGKKYYAKHDKDVEKVDIRYIDNIKIPDDCSYKSGKTKNDLKVEEKETNTEYEWANTQDAIYTITKNGSDYYLNKAPSESYKIILGSGQTANELVESSKEFGGIYFTNGSSSNNKYVKYMSVQEDDNWGPAYDKEGVYRDRTGKTAYIPKGFQVSKLSSLNLINTGLVIRNATTNEKYVWIEVPEIALKNQQGEIAGTLEEIEDNLKRYVSTYMENGYQDTYYDGAIGANKLQEYNNLKTKLYQSIKDKGGFWISRDESQQEKKAYEAYAIVSAETVEGRNKSLLFGIQWDLICKFLENVQADSNGELLNIRNLVGNGEITIESTSTNSPDVALSNQTVLRGMNLLKDRNTVPYTEAKYYRATIF